MRSINNLILVATLSPLFAIYCSNLIAADSIALESIKTEGSDAICEQGTFFDDELLPESDSRNVCESELIGNHPELFAPVFIYCLGTIVVNESTQAFCGCDCLWAHRATGKYAACVQEARHTRFRTTACKCEYKPGENPCFPSETSGSDPGTGILDLLKEPATDTFEVSPTDVAIRDEEVDNLDDPVADIIARKCKPFMEVVITLVCEAGPINYLTKILYGLDLCQIDCKCSHGSTKPPYGRCRVEPDGALGKPVSICYCNL